MIKMTTLFENIKRTHIKLNPISQCFSPQSRDRKMSKQHTHHSRILVESKTLCRYVLQQQPLLLSMWKHNEHRQIRKIVHDLKQPVALLMHLTEEDDMDRALVSSICLSLCRKCRL
jgi:hypothetical protein